MCQHSTRMSEGGGGRSEVEVESECECVSQLKTGVEGDRVGNLLCIL